MYGGADGSGNLDHDGSAGNESRGKLARPDWPLSSRSRMQTRTLAPSVLSRRWGWILVVVMKNAQPREQVWWTEYLTSANGSEHMVKPSLHQRFDAVVCQVDTEFE